MRRFVFRLEKVLDIRKRREDACRKRFARLCGGRDEEKRILGGLRREYDEAYAQRSGADLEETLTLLHCTYRLRARSMRQEERIRRYDLVCERQRWRLVEAGRETLKLERLRERRKSEFEAEAARRERKEADETARGVFLMRGNEYA